LLATYPTDLPAAFSIDQAVFNDQIEIHAASGSINAHLKLPVFSKAMMALKPLDDAIWIAIRKPG
jgi:hypothetical protein